jgi:hypothetical protein
MFLTLSLSKGALVADHAAVGQPHDALAAPRQHFLMCHQK